MSTNYAKYSGLGGSGGGVPIYANLAAFPVSAVSGDLGVAADTGNLYEWSGSAWRQIGGPGAALAIGVFGSSPNADGLTLSGGTLNMQPADSTHSGGLSSTDWNTFNNKQAALTIGNLTDAGTDGIVVTGGTGSIIGSGTSLAQHVADASHNGYLSSTDWSTFNNKQATLSIGALDAQAENANGLALVSNVLSVQSADATHPGVVNNTTQTFSGAKTFTGKVMASGNSGIVGVGSYPIVGFSGNSSLTLVNSAGDPRLYFFNGSALSVYLGLGDSSGLAIVDPGSGAQLISVANSSFTAQDTSGKYYLSASTSGVSILNSSGAVTIAANATTTPFTLTMPAAQGSTGKVLSNSDGAGTMTWVSPVTTLAAVGSSPSANGASISSNTLTLQPFDGTHPGVVTASGGGTTNFLRADGSWAVAGTGTVTAVSVASTNGFAGSSSGGATPALTLSTTITGILKGNATAISAATSGTDYSAGTSGLATGIIKSTTTTGTLTIAVAGDFPTLNQNTTGSAAKWTTARNLAGNSVDGSANVAFSNAFIVQGTADAGLSGAQFLGALATGIVKNTTTTGALTIAVAGDFPTLNQNTSGTAAGLSATLAIASGGTGQTSKAAAFDGLSPMTTGGDLIYGGASGTGTRLANGSSGQVLTSSGTTAAPTWTSAPNPLLSITSQTTTYTALTTDDLILCSGSAFTVTLYTAVGNTGKVLRIKKTDASLTNAVTIDGNGSQTIDGALTVQCSTQYEEWTITSDGSNWQVLAHSYPSDFVAYTPTFTGAGTVTNVKMYSRRVGDSLHVRGTWQCGTVTASTAAISLGYGGTDGNITTAGTGKIGSTLGLVGNAAFNGTGVAVEHVIAINGATVVNISNTSATSTGLVAAAGNSCWSNSQVESVDFMLPVAGWNG